MVQPPSGHQQVEVQSESGPDAGAALQILKPVERLAESAL
jgi:hypothetical protein